MEEKNIINVMQNLALLKIKERKCLDKIVYEIKAKGGSFNNEKI